MINIAVCDDEQSVCDAVCSTCEEIVGNLTFEACSVIPFLNPIELLEALEKYSFDLILCDIYMPGIMGTDAIQELRDKGNDVHVIFITSSKDHAVDAFALHADNYLVKPFSRQQLSDAITPVLRRVFKERQEFINVKTVEGSAVHVDFSKFCYAETVGHNQQVHLTDGDTFELRQSSSALYEQLQSDERFFKAGSSYILNLDNIRSIRDGVATMVDDTEIVIPIRLRKQVQSEFLERTFNAE